MPVTASIILDSDRLAAGLAAGRDYLLGQQRAGGYWWAPLESNVTMTAEWVLLHKIWGTAAGRPLAKVETYLVNQQREHGGWELYAGDGGDLNCTVEAYMALKLLGRPAADSVMVRARDFVLSRGGVTRTRIFTKLNLALIGCYSWQGLPSLPPWIMLLPEWGPFSIYDMSSWARSSTVPLLVVFDKKPVYAVHPAITLDELYVEAPGAVRYELARQGDWRDLFIGLDQVFKWAERLNWVPLREEGLRAAERWVIERQEATGDWGGIQPAMVNSLLALRCLGYDRHDPEVVRGFAAIDHFCLETDTEYQLQACVSPVWDTGLAVRALVDAGLNPDHPALVAAGRWLLEKQILAYGDWAIKNRAGRPGAWAFEFENRFYPDVDDTAVVVMALAAIQMPAAEEPQKRRAMQRAADWIATMQCRPGGWAAFDVDNDQDWLNQVPYGDLKAMIDPNTADVTARVLEMVGRVPLGFSAGRVQRAVDYVLKEQEPEGCWFGRWGVNYIYGTSGVLSALALMAPQERPALERGARWLVAVQNADGGWGETCRSYDVPSLKGQGPSTPSQTAWAILGLLAAGDALGIYESQALGRGIDYLLSTQQADGHWDEDWYTGTGFPSHFYLRYHLYRQVFPLMALGRYQQWRGRTTGGRPMSLPSLRPAEVVTLG
ncbi:MAG: squalene--hopene cyclase [Gloeomargaritaceae cyanobacterium C42_A2020_066]|nr:squalene--hopene cyclase [Gloeomargaritaceae cyanobacterium C42_A2020_066]